VKIANELPEIQYLNFAELCVVKHPEHFAVLIDKAGRAHSIANPDNPESALSLANLDISDLITTRDQKHFQFHETQGELNDSTAKNGVIMNFNVPEESKSGKLIIRAKNSYWGDYVMGEFNRKFGDKYRKWIRKKGKEGPEKPMKWKLEQSLPLMVYAETKEGWQFIDYFDMAGPLAFRDMVMQIDFSGIKGKDRSNDGDLRIKIETGFMLWELDYVAMDFSPNLPVEIIAIPPSSAINESRKNVRKSLMANDNKYYVQPTIGDEVILTFDAPVTGSGITSSIFLHVKGYYEHIRYFNHAPEREELETFRMPGRLSKYSYELFLQESEKYKLWLSSKANR
jgi:hypothetical protein